MRRSITLAVVILIVSQLSFAQQTTISKDSGKWRADKALEPIYQTRKVHPLERIFGARKPEKSKSRDTYQKLLVLLVDFQEDDDPATTGNGKFVLTADSTHIIPLDSPPRDKVYFENQLIALNKYYRAVSQESFNVQYDIFPAYNDVNVAYTLPHEMAYYNPGTQDNDLLISRFEEYFHDIFTIADQDENIVFGDYEHFMIIHAGSDWQHDRNGDSPHDIPSFFIQVGDGKEVVVDNGATTITHACNIPETITQDVRQEGNVYFNYGVINSVMVHEFGHSLGFVDLYNTSNYNPGVGYYDIMDAGGNVLIGNQFENLPGNIFYLEGTNPIFPGAFSRSIPFEEYYRSMGAMKDISEIPFDQEIKLLPIGKKYQLTQLAENEMFILKIPLSDTEYILLENRQVDPDGDGGTIFIGGLNNSAGYSRLILGPSSTNESDTNYNYEYDYLLPGWQSGVGNNFGGGIVAWHVDEKLLYKDDNMTNNTVNTNYFRRAVKILEADDIQDIASPYSHFWQGTAYDPFFKYQPEIDDRNFFEGWQDQVQINADGTEEFIGEYAAPELSASTSPALKTNDGTPSIYRIYDISSYDINYHDTFSGFPGRIMSFKVGTNLFDHTQVIESDMGVKQIGMIGENFSQESIAVLDNKLHLYSNILGDWAENLVDPIDFTDSVELSMTSVDMDLDGNMEQLIVSEDKLYNYSVDGLSMVEYDSPIMTAPIYLPEQQILVVATENKLLVGTNDIDLSVAKISYDGTNIIALAEDKVCLISADGNIVAEVAIEDLNLDYEPISYNDSDDSKDAVFVIDKQGSIWKVTDQKAKKIFDLAAYSTEMPTNIAIADIFDDSVPYLVLAAGDRIFAITMNGTLAPNFPDYLEDRNFSAMGHPMIIKFDNQNIIYIPADNSYFAINNQADYLPAYSFGWDMKELDHQIYWSENDDCLNLIYSEGSSIKFASKQGITENPILWNGYRNGALGLVNGAVPQFTNSGELSSMVFPNPIENGEARIRVSNATENIKLKIYDVAGNKLYSKNIEHENNSYQDLVWDCSKISSGVYFAVIKSGSKINKLSLAIIK